MTGLAEFRTITDACECLILANNCPIPHKCKKLLSSEILLSNISFHLASNWPFFFKLTFSATPITEDDAKSGEDMDTSLATITIGNGNNASGSSRRHHGQKSPNDDNRNDSSNEHRRHRHSSPST